MATYYNEIEPFAAAWLRELIEAGNIAPGEVDERSIEDVVPSDLMGYSQCHFFAGIGVWSYALRQAGWPDDRPVWTGSCPCQPFSAAGKGGGFTDERHLWPAFHHLIRVCKPAIVFGEQVASKDGLAWFDLVQSDLECEGYACGAVDTCAAGFGAPHIRQRLYWVGVDTLGYAALRGRVRRECGNKAATEQTTLVGGENERCWWNDPADDGACMRLANAEGGGQRLCIEQSDGDAGQYRASGGTVRVANSHGGRCGASRFMGELSQIYRGGDDQRMPPTIPSICCGMEYTSGIGRPQGRNGDREHDGVQPCAVNYACGVEHPTGDRREPRGAESGGRESTLGCSKEPARPSPTKGPWGTADWLLCRDGKWRAVEPSTFPLAYGATNRVGRLRGYGNAIVAPQAEAFIRAYMSIYKEQTL